MRSLRTSPELVTHHKTASSQYRLLKFPNSSRRIINSSLQRRSPRRRLTSQRSRIRSSK